LRSYLVAGNWKMNGSLAANAALVDAIAAGVSIAPKVEMLVCPSSPYLDSVGRRIAQTGIFLGAQDLCEQPVQGAFTGEVHSSMLIDLGCRYVLVGHSERRALYGESDALVAEKFAAAQAGKLIPILCIGETLDERESGQTEAVLSRQLLAILDRNGIAAFANAVVAYEPVWAIGTGRTATVEQAQSAHAYIRSELAKNDAKIADLVRLLYGGSVKADNAASLFSCEDVDGGLIGGASLKATEFLAIYAAALAA